MEGEKILNGKAYSAFTILQHRAQNLDFPVLNVSFLITGKRG